MSGIIQPGDIIQNHEHADVLVTEVTKGHFGLLIKGNFVGVQISFTGYVPFELPPIEVKTNWCGWADRAYITLPNGVKVGDVGVLRTTPNGLGIEYYDKKWLETDMPAEEISK